MHEVDGCSNFICLSQPRSLEKDNFTSLTSIAISLQDKVKELTAEKATRKTEKGAVKKKMNGLRADAPERCEINEQHKKAAAALKAKKNLI